MFIFGCSSLNVALHGLSLVATSRCNPLIVEHGLSCLAAARGIFPDQGTRVPCIVRQIFNHWTTREAPGQESIAHGSPAGAKAQKPRQHGDAGEQLWVLSRQRAEEVPKETRSQPELRESLPTPISPFHLYPKRHDTKILLVRMKMPARLPCPSASGALRVGSAAYPAGGNHRGPEA